MADHVHPADFKASKGRTLRKRKHRHIWGVREDGSVVQVEAHRAKEVGVVTRHYRQRTSAIRRAIEDFGRDPDEFGPDYVRNAPNDSHCFCIL